MLNTGEYGQLLYANLKEDILAGTDLTFILEPKRGNKQTKTANITIGTVSITVEDERLLANQYLIYTVQEGDFTDSNDSDSFLGGNNIVRFSGTGWRTRGEATVGSKRIVGDFKKLRVLA